MGAFMPGDFTSVREWFATVRTCKWPLPCVRSHVNHKSTIELKTLPTFRTFVFHICTCCVYFCHFTLPWKTGKYNISSYMNIKLYNFNIKHILDTTFRVIYHMMILFLHFFMTLILICCFNTAGYAPISCIIMFCIYIYCYEILFFLSWIYKSEEWGQFFIFFTN